MPSVDTDQLIRQMETMADNLDVCPDTEEIATMIRGWVNCVNILLEEDEESERAKQDAASYSDVTEAVSTALKDAGGYSPLGR